MDKQWGKYHLKRLIARGGMAEVFEAEMTGPAEFVKRVCLKRVRGEFSDDDKFRRMFESEACIAATLHHSNIVQVFDFDCHEDQFFLAMEFIDGLDLHLVLRNASRLGLRVPIGFAVHIMEGLLQALDHAHRHIDKGRLVPVVHRDVSPHNILISIDGVVKLTDFGIAKAIGNSDITQTGVFKGKPAYLSPEQVDGKAVSPRSDLFSAGLIFYEMLVGQRFFKPEHYNTTMINMLNVTFSPIPGLAKELNMILGRLLAKDPNDRFESAKAAHTAIEEAGVPGCGETAAGEVVKALKDKIEETSRQPLPVRPGAGPPVGGHNKKFESALRTHISEETQQPVPEMPNPARVPNRKSPVALFLFAVLGLGVIVLVFLLFGLKSEVASEFPVAHQPVVPLGEPHASKTRPKTQQHVLKKQRQRKDTSNVLPPVVKLSAYMDEDIPDSSKAGEPKTDASKGIVESNATPNVDPKAFDPKTVSKTRSEISKTSTRTGVLDVNVRPWAMVKIDRKMRGVTPLKNLRLNVGPHKVTLSNNELGYRETLMIRIRREKPTIINKQIALKKSTQE